MDQPELARGCLTGYPDRTGGMAGGIEERLVFLRRQVQDITDFQQYRLIRWPEAARLERGYVFAVELEGTTEFGGGNVTFVSEEPKQRT